MFCDFCQYERNHDCSTTNTPELTVYFYCRSASGISHIESSYCQCFKVPTVSCRPSYSSNGPADCRAVSRSCQSDSGNIVLGIVHAMPFDCLSRLQAALYHACLSNLPRLAYFIETNNPLGLPDLHLYHFWGINGICRHKSHGTSSSNGQICTARW